MLIKLKYPNSSIYVESDQILSIEKIDPTHKEFDPTSVRDVYTVITFLNGNEYICEDTPDELVEKIYSASLKYQNPNH